MITAQSSHSAPAKQVHGNSMHRKVRAVLDRGLDHEWSSKEVSDLLGMELRSAQQLMSSVHLKCFAHPTKNTERGVRRTTGLSLLIYLIRHSDEMTEADALPALKKLLPLLTDIMLEGVIGAARAIIQKRQRVLVVVKEADPQAAALPQTAPTKAASKAPATAMPEFSFVDELT